MENLLKEDNKQLTESYYALLKKHKHVCEELDELRSKVKDLEVQLNIHKYWEDSNIA